MENKKNYVDGVDVSKCRYLFDDTAYKHSKTSCSITLKDCKYLGNDCYYKQLKRKEQFLKEIEKEITTYRLKYDTTHTASKLLDSLASKIRKELYE